MTRQTTSQGFTLLEMLVVLAIMSLVLVISIPFVSGSDAALRLEADSRIVMSRLREARELALLTRRPQTVRLQMKTLDVLGPAARPVQHLAGTRSLIVVTAKGLVDGAEAALVFYEDGGATGGQIELINDEARYRLSINWLTGTVTAETLETEP